MSENQNGPTLAEAYTEACTALGEAVIEKRLIAKQASTQIDALSAEVERLGAGTTV